ncbi:MAG: TonB-dependent receptor [Bacteroidota bacterium]
MAQSLTQTVRGIIIDQDTRSPLPGANIIVLHSQPLLGANSGIDGRFRIEKVPVGRQDIKISFIGYDDIIVSQTEVLSAKELVLTIELHQKAVFSKEVVISATAEKENPVNEMSIISTRNFSIEETNRFAGAWGDPSRMVSNFAGVSIVSDKRNDIIVRGNSPVGVLWMLDGIEIPNPNHFAVAGSSGGAISMINNNLLDNSDFSTGAFSAEYGNATSAVFDLRMRNGNNEKREYLFQVGAHGFELGMEGPFIKGKSASYMASYRYSTLALLDLMGISLIDAVPIFQDLTVKLNFPIKKGSISFFALGGKSKAVYHPDKDSSSLELPDDRYGYASGSDMGVAGITWLWLLNKNTYMKTSLSSSLFNPYGLDDSTGLNQKIYELSSSSLTEQRNVMSVTFNSKLNPRHLLRWGVNGNYIRLDNNSYKTSWIPAEQTTKINEFTGDLTLLQAFFQWKYSIRENLTLNAGSHFLYLLLNKHYSIEPRVALRWSLGANHAISAGVGIHGLTQPTALYYTEQIQPDGSILLPNKKLDFTKALHYVLGYDWMISENLHMRLEAYYQGMYNVPISLDNPTLSMLNFGTSDNIFTNSTFRNDGKGRNYGIEATFEKFFSKGSYFLLTGSLFDSKYTDGNGIIHDTRFNCRYAANLLAGQEFKLGRKKKNTIGVSTAVIAVGGQHFTPINLDASRMHGYTVLYDSLAFKGRFKDYFKVDLRLRYIINSRRFSHEIALECANIFNRSNVESINYNPNTGEIVYGYQLPRVPVFSYRLMF